MEIKTVADLVKFGSELGGQLIEGKIRPDDIVKVMTEDGYTHDIIDTEIESYEHTRDHTVWLKAQE